MTIKIKVTDRPVVKATNPELYVNHTYHMKKAINYTYNYSAVDDYVVENWPTNTMKAMANDLNEYPNRIEYRVKILKAVGLIEHKTSNHKQGRLSKEYKVLMTRAKAIKKQLKESA